ncbi:MAG TPA: SAM-dependent methyltransferase [Anaerolineaceae bacterium]|nr:SAM-dependent methyltransferase [Anaerolineaceae bacterium]
MNINVDRLRKQLHAFDFRKLFINELGWDKANTDATVQVDGQDYCLQAVAQKRGLVVFHCPTPAGQPFPDYAIRRKIDAKARKTFHEHLIIFTDTANTQQKWQWVRREPGKPSAGREIGFGAGQSGEALIQRLQTLAFSLEEEEGLTIVDVTSRVRAGFDLERVTKRFYERFKTEQMAFLKFLQGIPDEDMQRWYISVTLNRLMFVYFIQWKGFLDGDQHYLRNRLERTRQQLGEDRFYREFLCPLFFEGFAKKERSPQARALLGNVPYLNGGIFQRHQLEERFGQAIQIPDAAFTRLFDFFDGYNWHLDERPLRDDKEINPDVLGFIFEKYINQKQMGAYYTKEDITGYISKYTILPALFERARKDCRIAFEGESAVWKYLAADPDRYIYPAMLHGLDLPLPGNIAAGVSDVAQRGDWNRPAGEAHALPTEIWRETAARRQRAEEVRARLAAGEVRDINDLITYNLDIQQFAQDVIEGSEGPELVRAFWKSLIDIKVLDPTCGSGAFLFAALNTLEPLYEACLDRMQSFIDELDAAAEQGEKHRPEKFSDFRKTLNQVARHPNHSYFIFKSIIVQNLYGVDIMEEAVEICKLRLFLKLIAQVDGVEKIEPLPDIDFNVRAGNTLIGLSTREEVRRVLTSQGQQGTLGLFGENEAADRVEEQAELADKAFQRFRQMQTEEEMDSAAFASAKEELRKRFYELNNELNRALALRYLNAPIKEDAYKRWLGSYQPFHWFVDFYGIMKSGGFDVIIGNPPYVEYRIVKSEYQLDGLYKSASADNLYAFCMERSCQIIRTPGKFGMIVPAGIMGLDDAESLRKVLFESFFVMHFSSYAIRPSKLFDGVDQRLSIVLASKAEKRQSAQIWTTKYHHWNAEEREHLFSNLRYFRSYYHPRLLRIPQIGSQEAYDVIEKLEKYKALCVENYFTGHNSGFLLHYHRSPRYWIRAMDFEQYFKSPTRQRSIHHFRDLFFRDQLSGKVIGAILNSSLFFFWFISMGNGRNITGTDVAKFPIGTINADETNLLQLFDLLMGDYQKNSFIRVRQDCEFQEFRISKSKPLLDQIDEEIGQHYGFLAREIDFLNNLDVKYRLGRESEENEEE